MPESVLVRFKGELQPGYHAAGCRECDSLCGDAKRVADGGEGE
jgi:hypothetical protein